MWADSPTVLCPGRAEKSTGEGDKGLIGSHSPQVTELVDCLGRPRGGLLFSHGVLRRQPSTKSVDTELRTSVDSNLQLLTVTGDGATAPCPRAPPELASLTTGDSGHGFESQGLVKTEVPGPCSQFPVDRSGQGLRLPTASKHSGYVLLAQRPHGEALLGLWPAVVGYLKVPRSLLAVCIVP